MKNENVLIVFQKNAVLGKVKTRLAATVGDHKALEIYKALLWHTYSQIDKLEKADKVIFFSDFIEKSPLEIFEADYKEVQRGEDLGERMSNAFASLFQKGYKKVVIIGTDCPEIKSDDIKAAFKSLEENDVCIGPALDGGYYLIGMRNFYESLFQNIPWSSSEVTKITLEILDKQQISFQLLKTLSDIDTEEDLISFFPD